MIKQVLFTQNSGRAQIILALKIKVASTARSAVRVRIKLFWRPHIFFFNFSMSYILLKLHWISHYGYLKQTHVKRLVP